MLKNIVTKACNTRTGKVGLAALAALSLVGCSETKEDPTAAALKDLSDKVGALTTSTAALQQGQSNLVVSVNTQQTTADARHAEYTQAFNAFGQKLENVDGRLTGLASDVTAVKADVAGVKSEVAGLKDLVVNASAARRTSSGGVTVVRNTSAGQYGSAALAAVGQPSAGGSQAAPQVRYNQVQGAVTVNQSGGTMEITPVEIPMKGNKPARGVERIVGGYNILVLENDKGMRGGVREYVVFVKTNTQNLDGTVSPSFTRVGHFTRAGLPFNRLGDSTVANRENDIVDNHQREIVKMIQQSGF